MRSLPRLFRSTGILPLQTTLPFPGLPATSSIGLTPNIREGNLHLSFPVAEPGLQRKEVAMDGAIASGAAIVRALASLLCYQGSDCASRQSLPRQTTDRRDRNDQEKGDA